MADDINAQICVWKEAYGSDVNSITHAVHELTWNFGVYSTVAKIFELAPRNERGEPQLNYMIFDLLRSSYWVNSMMIIRRVCDSSYPVDGRKGVSSLGAVLRDVQRMRKKLTRKVLLESFGYRYDYETVREAYEKWAVEGADAGARWVPRELQWGLSAERHREVDYLTGTSEAARSPDDVVREEVVTTLLEKLESLKPVIDHATSYYAHSATAESREAKGALERWNVAEAWISIETIAKTAELTGRWFAGTAVGEAMATAQFDKFEHLETPVIQGASREALEENWERLSSEANDWSNVTKQWLEKRVSECF